MKREAVERKCRVCGCTDGRGCPPSGCAWIEADLCSACQPCRQCLSPGKCPECPTVEQRWATFVRTGRGPGGLRPCLIECLVLAPSPLEVPGGRAAQVAAAGQARRTAQVLMWGAVIVALMSLIFTLLSLLAP